MKINELQISTDLKAAKFPGDALDVLKKNEWTVLGRGDDAAVAEHPGKKYVLKLFLPYSQYRHFVEFAKIHQGNPHVPIFYGNIRKVPGVNWSYVRMEKLSSINKFTLTRDHLPEMCDLWFF